MEPAFAAYPALLHCGIYREVINNRPQPLSPVELELLEVTPPPDLEAFHDPDHLVSFARHLAGLIKSPIRKVQASGHTFFAILGVVVFYRRPDGTFATAMWERPSDKGGNWLVGFLPWDTPILDFPRTTLWQSHIHQGLIHEAQARIGNDCAAERWATWAWQLLQERLIDTIDLRRLRVDEERRTEGRRLGGTAVQVAAAGVVLPEASFTPHWHIQPVMRPGLPTTSA